MRFIILISFLVLANLSHGEQPSDSFFKKRIIGKWRAEYSGKIKFLGEGEYRKNGTFVGWGKLYFPDGTIKKSLYSDIWSIEDGKLIIKPNKIYDSQAMNETSVDTIISINEREMILLNSKGKKNIRTRVE